MESMEAEVNSDNISGYFHNIGHIHDPDNTVAVVKKLTTSHYFV